MKQTHDSQSAESAAMPLEEQKGIIINILNDFMGDVDTFLLYLSHIGFDLCAFSDARDLEAVLLGHYRIKVGRYDVDRACNDLLTWPPISNRIFELMREKSGS